MNERRTAKQAASSSRNLYFFPTSIQFLNTIQAFDCGTSAKRRISDRKISGFLNYFENSSRSQPEFSENQASATPLYITDVCFLTPVDRKSNHRHDQRRLSSEFRPASWRPNAMRASRQSPGRTAHGSAIVPSTVRAGELKCRLQRTTSGTKPIF